MGRIYFGFPKWLIHSDPGPGSKRELMRDESRWGTAPDLLQLSAAPALSHAPERPGGTAGGPFSGLFVGAKVRTKQLFVISGKF